MTDNTALAAACGLYCGDCEYLGGQCSGCGNVEGKPFWTGQLGLVVCPVYNCSVLRQGIEHCGLCEEFPCELFTSLRDPNMSDEEAENSVRARQENLRKRKEIGTEVWLREKSQAVE
jgi:hypothetical protein